MIALGLGTWGAVAASSGTGGTGDPPGADVSSAEVLVEHDPGDALPPEMERFRDEGWMRMNPLPASPEFAVPEEMYVQLVDDLATAGERLPLYATPSADAEPVGYYYLSLGFVPADVVDAGLFDLAAAGAGRTCADQDVDCKRATRDRLRAEALGAPQD